MNGVETNEDELKRNRKIRQRFKDLIKETQEKGAEDSAVLEASFAQADELFKDVSKPREAICDSTLMNVQCSIIKQKTQALHTNLMTFSPDKFPEKLLRHFEKKSGTPRTLERSNVVWRKLGDVAKSIITTSPPFHYIYGTFEPGVVEMKKRSKKLKDKDELSKIVLKPKIIDATSKSEQDLATEEAETILAILSRLSERNKTPICYFEFVINPDSFSDTIENMFYVAVLAKEGTVSIDIDSEGLPIIDFVRTDEACENRKHGTYSQYILSISMDEWKDIIQEFNIKKPILPTRKKPEENS